MSRPRKRMRPSSACLGAVQQPEQRALARAGGAGDEDELAPLDHEVHAAEHRLIAAIGLVDRLERQDRTTRRGRVESLARAENGAERALRNRPCDAG